MSCSGFGGEILVEIAPYRIDALGPHCEKYPPSACRLVICTIVSGTALGSTRRPEKSQLTHSFLHSRYALGSLLSVPRQLIKHHPPLDTRHSREVFLAHSSVTSIPIQTLDAHRGSLLAWVEPLALTLAVGGTWSATFRATRTIAWSSRTL